MSVNEKMTAIADNIRKYTKDTDKLNLDQMAAAVDKVHEKGKQEQYDAFWDAYQGKGTRTSYVYAFIGFGFNSDNFYPKYNIKIEGYSTHVFYGWSEQKATLDLKSRLDECGVTLDTSKATNLSNMFNYSTNISRVPTIDVTGLSGTSTNLFANTYGGLKKIEKIKTNETVVYQNWFSNSYIEEIAFEGVIGQSIAFNACPFTKASIQNIVEHLSTTSSGMTVTFKTSAVNAAFTTDEWNALKATRTNWTFALA